MHRCNGEVELGSKALDDVLYRAQLELFPEPLLVSETLFFCLLFLREYNRFLLRYSALCGSECVLQ